MPALNFQKRFASAVARGEKTQTIRAERKDNRLPCRQGDVIILYTGMRTKGCRKLGSAICSSVQRIIIKANGTVKMYGQVLCRATVDDIAMADGFESTADFLDFFKQPDGQPFKGYLIRWLPPSEKTTPGKAK